jgi:5-methylcytosine-specific restriction endonuclease McrA
MPETDPKVLARHKVQRAVRSGRLIRPHRCQRCGTVGLVEGSHDDYTKPLEVEWLCRDCHTTKDLPATCGKGHPYTPENTYIKRSGVRQCRECARAGWRRYYWRRWG